MDFFRSLYQAFCSADNEEEQEQEIELPEHLATIREQMEFYFSDSNVEGSAFMKEQLAKRDDRYVPIQLFLTFNRIKSLNATEEEILEACAASRFLQVDKEQMLVRSKKPFVSDPRRPYRTFTMRGFDKTETLESLQAFFKKNHVKPVKITMRRSTQKGTGEKYFSGMVDVEVDTEENAQKIVNEGLEYNGKKLRAILIPDMKKSAQTTPRKSPRRM